MKNILFFYPDRNIGGGPYWLIRLANALAKDNMYYVYYADYNDGFTHSMTEAKQSNNIHFIDYNENNSSFLINEPCICFSPVYEIHKLPLLHPNSKLLLHNWHNLCFPMLKSIMNFSDKDLTYFISYINEKKAQVFLDYTHYLAAQTIVNINLYPQFIPMVVKEKNYDLNFNIIDNKTINIAYLGRIVPDKIHAINNIIKCAINYSKKINIHIIGDGESVNQILEPHDSNIKIIKCGRLVEYDLYNYLIQKIDILFAMGTSVLDGASLSIPSVVIPTSMDDFYYDKFLFVHNSKDYVTGYEIGQDKKLDLQFNNFDSIINIIYNEHKKFEIGQAGLEHIKNYHSIHNAIYYLKEYLNLTNLKYSDLFLLRKLYLGVRYNTNHISPQTKKFCFKFLFIPITMIKGNEIKIKIFNNIQILNIHRDSDNIYFSLFGIFNFSRKLKVSNV